MEKKEEMVTFFKSDFNACGIMQRNPTQTRLHLFVLDHTGRFHTAKPFFLLFSFLSSFHRNFPILRRQFPSFAFSLRVFNQEDSLAALKSSWQAEAHGDQTPRGGSAMVSFHSVFISRYWHLFSPSVSRDARGEGCHSS